jgi:hemolysins and related proteins containing CBS domains
LTDAEEASGIPFTEEERENFDTLNGFLIAKLNHFPEDNERTSIRAHGFLFQILKAEDRMIKTVKVEWQEEE